MMQIHGHLKKVREGSRQIAKPAIPVYIVITASNATSGNFKVNQQNVIDGKALLMPKTVMGSAEMANSTPEDYNWAMMDFTSGKANENSRLVYTFTDSRLGFRTLNMDMAKEFIKLMYPQLDIY